MTIFIDSLTEICNKYNNFIIDLCGVVHNGVSVYPDANQAVRYLVHSGKAITFLSNSPRKSANVTSKLQEFGLNLDSTQVITSGDLFLEQFYNTMQNEKLYVISGKNSPDIIEEIKPNIVDNIEDATTLLNLSVTTEPNKVNIYRPELNAAIKHGLTLLCPNPDKSAPHGDHYHFPSGATASLYEKMGGEVVYFGKPYLSAYAKIMKDINDPRETIAIGDNLETDVLGAKNIGCDSLLVCNGIYREVGNVKGILAGSFITPDYAINNFKV